MCVKIGTKFALYGAMIEKFIVYTILICVLCMWTNANALAQGDSEGGEGGGDAFARERLYGTWSWVNTVRNPNRGGREAVVRTPQGEMMQVTFDRSGKVTVQRNGSTINTATFNLVEDDSRLTFTKWDSPTAFVIDGGPFDFENNLLWIRGEYNDKGGTWQFTTPGTAAAETYTPPANTPTTHVISTPAPNGITIPQPATRPVPKRARKPATGMPARKTATKSK